MGCAGLGLAQLLDPARRRPGRCAASSARRSPAPGGEGHRHVGLAVGAVDPHDVRRRGPDGRGLRRRRPESTVPSVVALQLTSVMLAEPLRGGDASQ